MYEETIRCYAIQINIFIKIHTDSIKKKDAGSGKVSGSLLEGGVKKCFWLVMEVVVVVFMYNLC